MLAGALTPCFFARLLLMPRLVDNLPLERQAARQFKLDMTLYAIAGAGMAWFNDLAFDFPFVGSGSKLVLGVVALGLFASVDLALERERLLIVRAMKTGKGKLRPPEQLYPLTKKFTLIATASVLLVSMIVSLLVWRDLIWLSHQALNGARIDELKSEVYIEIAFVMGALLLLSVNLILSYSRNLRLLFTSQTRVLERVSRGDLDGVVPVLTEDEFGFIAGHTNSMIEGLRDRLRMREGLMVAQEVQQNLLPNQAPEVPGLEIAATSRYSDETGGDYYDFFNHCGEKCGAEEKGRDIGIVVGDVSGHGVGPALLMATARALFKLRMVQGGELGMCVSDVNRYLAHDLFGSGRFMTLFALLVCGESRGLIAVSAGHDPAIIYDPESDSFEELRSRGLPLGVEEHWSYEEVRHPALRKGQVLCIGTDGIWEASNSSGEMYGKDRLREVIRARAGGSALEIRDAVLAGVAAFSGHKRQEDDITLVVVKSVV